MPEIDVLQQALQELEDELTKFKSAKKSLDEAREKADADLKRWEKQQAFDSSQRDALVEVVKRANASNTELVARIEPLADKLLSVAKAVDSAGFPHRLDLLQVNTANAVSTIQSIQSRLDLLEVNQGNAIKLAVDEVKKGLSDTEWYVFAIEKKIKKVIMPILILICLLLVKLIVIKSKTIP